MRWQLKQSIEKMVADPLLLAMKDNNITTNYFGERLLEMLEEIVDDEKEEYIRKLLAEKHQQMQESQHLKDLVKEVEHKIQEMAEDK